VATNARSKLVTFPGWQAGVEPDRQTAKSVAAMGKRAFDTDTQSTTTGFNRSAASRPPYEAPAAVLVVDELPGGAALEVNRRRLTAMLEELRGEDAPQPAGTG
jgi:hypothetical protein